MLYKIEKFSASVDLLQPLAAVLVDQVRDKRADEAEERDADVGDDRPGLLVAFRYRSLACVTVRLLRIAGLPVLLRRITLLRLTLLCVRLLVRIAVLRVALLITSLLIRVAVLIALLLVAGVGIG